MPAQTATSADKIRAAQVARRQAAQRSAAANRRSRPKPAAPVASPSPASTNDSIATPAATEDRLADLCDMVESNPSALGTDTNSVRQLCRARRQSLSTQGKKAASGQTSSRRRTRPARSAVVNAPNPVVLDEVVTENIPSPQAQAELNSICELVETNPSALGPDANSIRQVCRNRRQALSTKGKAAIAGKKRTASRASVEASFLHGDSNTRDMARKRRQEMATKGRTGRSSRPTGRIRPTPTKVETGTTLSGSPVTGTQVERKGEVTGNEAGTCRIITGTEYVGSEQFTHFCGSQPEANPAKVGISITGGGLAVSGTEVGRSSAVTGDEPGACRTVTGTEYLGAERFAEFCESKGLNSKPAKVVSSTTERKQISVTGADEARPSRATGHEAGAQRAITGSQYADSGSAKLTINGPSKVALTHTIAGMPVTGTEVGRSAKVTGDEHGSCRPVTGTEYLSNEQFASVCQTQPIPSPAKVGIDHTQKQQAVTGNLVDRTEKVTGNEPGSCQKVTGSQYSQNKLCGGAAPKVHNMHTLSGSVLTGNRVDQSPKFNGGEPGGCQPVTGIEYFGQEQAEHCQNTPPARPAKVGIEHTPQGLHVSGTMMNATSNVTGNKSGSTQAISGTPYAAVPTPAHHGACCDSCAARQAAEAAGLVAPQVPPPPTPQQSQHVAVAPAPAQYPAYPATQAERPMYAAPAPQQTVATPPAGFISQTPPAQSVQAPNRSRITGNADHGYNRVTGPSNMGQQWVSGTPEFRHAAHQQPMMAQPQPVAPAPIAVPATAPTPEPMSLQQPLAAQTSAQAAPPEQATQRITGEGRDGGISITGDNWARGHQITGTEGRSAQGRNPTLRCEARGAAFNAHVNRELERPTASVSAVTGSSGNTHQGAVITVSGGARG